MHRSQYIRATLINVTILALGFVSSASYAESERRYSRVEAERGQPLYAANCASCHGAQGQGQSKAEAGGQNLAPALNGSAHTWHHPLKALHRTLAVGGVKIGGRMPAFKASLTDGQRSDILAYVQSFWSDAIYNRWSERNLAASRPRATTLQKDLAPELRLLAQQVGGQPLTAPQPTPVAGIISTTLNGKPIYLSADGRYVFTGDLIDLKTGVNLSEAQGDPARLKQVNQFGVEKRIVYPAQGAEKARLVVLTDTTCPFCRKLHKEVPQLQQAGISVQYIPFPRNGLQGEGARQMRQVWCNSDPAKALDIAKGSQPGSLKNGEKCAAAAHVAAGYQLGQAIGVTGTPSLIFPNGQMISGYRPAADLIKSLTGK